MRWALAAVLSVGALIVAALLAQTAFRVLQAFPRWMYPGLACATLLCAGLALALRRRRGRRATAPQRLAELPAEKWRNWR